MLHFVARHTETETTKKDFFHTVQLSCHVISYLASCFDISAWYQISGIQVFFNFVVFFFLIFLVKVSPQCTPFRKSGNLFKRRFLNVLPYIHI